MYFRYEYRSLNLLHATPSRNCRWLQENKLEALVIDEWRGVSSDGAETVCDSAGGICPWVVNGTGGMGTNISTSAAALMVS